MSLEVIKDLIRTVPDFPKAGIQFRDTTTLIKSPQGLALSIDALAQLWPEDSFESIVAIDARGFIFGSALSYKLGKGLVLARKKGKLPAATESESYALEYGHDQIEIHKDSIKKGGKYLVIDDLIATGGTAKATCSIIDRLGGEVVGCGFVIELDGLEGRQVLSKYEVKSLIHYN